MDHHPNFWLNKKCSKSPTRYVFAGWIAHFTGSNPLKIRWLVWIVSSPSWLRRNGFVSSPSTNNPNLQQQLHIFLIYIYIYRTKCGLKQKNNYFDVAICNPLKNTHTNTDRNAVQLPKILGSQAGWPCDHSWLPQHEIAWPSWDPKSRQKIQHTLIRDWNILANNVQKQWSITSCFFLDLIFCWYWIYWVVGPMWGGEFKIRGARIIFHDYQPFEVGHLDWIYTRRSLLPDSVPPQYISISVVCS